MSVFRPAIRRGFTLIELLVVVAIIALLMAILLPSLSKAREQAKSVACQANLHSLGQAFGNYLSEAGGIYPMCGNSWNASTGPQWFRSILQDPALPATFVNGTGVKADADGKWKLLICPNDLKNKTGVINDNIVFGNVSYGYNVAGFGGISNHSAITWIWGTPATKVPHLMNPVRASAVTDPANVILLLDNGIGSSTPDARGWYRAYPWNDPNNGVAVPRHPSGTGGSCNVLWGDGHAEPVFVASGRNADLYLPGKLGDPWAGNPPRNHWWWMP